jgi:hypothetical protein
VHIERDNYFAMAHTLPEMPVEIFHAVIDEMLEDKQDRGARRREMQTLRQVCRDIEVKTRVGYGQEVFARRALFVTPDSLAKMDAILSDEVFRGCVRDITVLIDHSSPSSGDDADWDELLSNVDITNLQQHLNKMFQRLRQVERIAIDSPSLSSDASSELRKNVEERWNEVVATTLDAIMAQERLCVETFEIGCCSSEAVPIPAHLVKGLPRDSTALTGLQELFLYHVVAGSPTDAKHGPVSTQTLAEFLALAPSLDFLRCQGMDLSAANVERDTMLGSNPNAALPPITALGLSSMSTTEVNLTESLLLFSSTLEALYLDNINMTAGSWQAIFHIMWHKLNLKIYRSEV